MKESLDNTFKIDLCIAIEIENDFETFLNATNF